MNETAETEPFLGRVSAVFPMSAMTGLILVFEQWTGHLQSGDQISIHWDEHRSEQHMVRDLHFALLPPQDLCILLRPVADLQDVVGATVKGLPR
ncbi:hypothetical protein GO986_10660 [Deinococcus sp. HMF7620]|uniref:Uncharacterized protein n=1 Tax=Deinococcus arboris TaxID=2682977 RepID=A0A7C9I3A6_9DEIO|nr:hypothetical protein [Deinococcus arboris]MVN87231.1 hypothetical protein [Deinococcus arboris]